MIDLDDYDCQKCGACCVADYEGPDYVHLLEEDMDQLTYEEQSELVYVERNYGRPQTSMKTCTDSHGNCRCIALDGVVGERVSCTIYDRRPSACRRFQSMTDVCDYARQAAFGISPK